MKKKILAGICTLFACLYSFGQETYSKISVDPNQPQLIETLVQLGMAIDHYEITQNGQWAFFVTQEERKLLETQQIPFKVLIPNYREYYQDLLQEDLPNQQQMQRFSMVADGFNLGSMGGFYTLAEMEAKLDEMRANYPNLINEKSSIGTSNEGRPIWMVKISDNPEVDENEPTAYFDGVHHAREPLSMATNINYMFWLLENYGTNEQVTYLIDNRELYFVPIVNPDGYEYNRSTNPDGGGLWRKNRKDNAGSSCIGVDLNRNYGFGYAIDNSCSSPDPCSGVYRGEMAFSEPETSAVRDFMALVNPNTAFSIHSTAGSYLMPYGYDTSPPAFDIYSEWASDFLSENDYPYGVTFQMLGYTSCGTTRDYMHSEEIYGWTPEIDGQGFWPPPSTIFDLVAENVYPLFFQSWIAGGFVDIQSHALLGTPLPGETFSLATEVKNVGLEEAPNVTVKLTTTHPEVTLLVNEISYGTLAARTRDLTLVDPFSIAIPSTFLDAFFDVTLTTYQDGVLNKSLDLRIFVGANDLLYEDDVDNSSNDWTASGNNIDWGIVEDDAYSGTQCYGDSNGGNSLNDTQNFFELNPSFDFSSSVTPIVSFAAKHSIEIFDVVEFQISPDNGSTWEVLDTFTRNKSWYIYQKSLVDYVGFTEVKFRFAMNTDGFLPGDGFYFDDFKLLSYDTEILNTSEMASIDFSVFPNPTTGELHLKFSALTSHNWEVKVHDLHGRQVLPSYFETGTQGTLSLESLESGLYFIKVYYPEGASILRRVIKN